MPTIEIHYKDREMMPDLLESKASELGLTVEQLVKRFISSGMQQYEPKGEPMIPGESLDDFFVKNGVLKART